MERTYLISLRKRAVDKREKFLKDWETVKSAFPVLEIFNAIDGSICKRPNWWKTPFNGAWGCLRSHLSILEQAMSDGLGGYWVFEDDAIFCEGFVEKFNRAKAALPDDVDLFYIGGQHLQTGRRPPIYINREIYLGQNINRTHAFYVHGKAFKKLYYWLLRQDWHGGHHIDHHLGRWMIEGKCKAYCTSEWLVGQRENYSHIQHKKFDTRFFLGASSFQEINTPWMCVLGTHSSGSSCTAGMLHKLGVSMGDLFAKAAHDDKGGGFEALNLARLCERIMPFPSIVPKEDPRPAILKWMRSRGKRPGMLGMKYPHLGLWVDSLPDIPRIICDRDLGESINSLIKRFPNKAPACVVVQEAIWNKLQQTNGLRLNWSETLSDPKGAVQKMVDYLDLSPTEQQLQAAIDHVILQQEE